MCVNSKNWCDELPMILLGLRTAFRDDLQCSVADMVYGQSLRIPGEFFQPSASNVDRSQFAQMLHQTFDNIQPRPIKSHGKRPIFINDDLKTCTHVFVRVDSVKRPLQPPYEGPFKVVERDTKFMDIVISGKVHRISIDRVKPAFVCNPDLDEYPQDDHRTKVTPSGHRVRFLV